MNLLKSANGFDEVSQLAEMSQLEKDGTTGFQSSLLEQLTEPWLLSVPDFSLF